MEVREEALAAVFAVLSPHLDERQRRLLAGAQARALGRGGIAMVARASGMARSTIRIGANEIDQDPGLLQALDALWSRPPVATPSRRCGGRASRPTTSPRS